MPALGSFIKKKDLFCLQFWKLKHPRSRGLICSSSGEGLMADGNTIVEAPSEKLTQKNRKME
jgi:hypothetical protein